MELVGGALDLGAGDWRERGPKVAGFLERNLRGWLDFFREIYERRVLARNCRSDKYRSAKDFPKILSVKFYINLLRPNLVD